MAKFLRVVGLDKFQHYKDRNPPWIKLHRELLTSNTWVELDDASRLLAVVCMLLAAETGNRIPLDGTFIQRRAYFKRRPDVRPLVAVGFAEIIEDKEVVQSASAALADASVVHQSAVPEGETEEETYTPEKEGEAKTENPPDGLHALQYAAGICDRLGLPCKGNLEVIADAVTAVSKFNEISVQGGYIFLLGKAQDALKAGVAVDKWWFQDAKWRKTGGGSVNKRDAEFEAAYQRAEAADGETSERVSKFSARSGR